VTRAATDELLRLQAAGYRVQAERFFSGRFWTLRGPDGGYLMIGDHGCAAPRQADAVAEGLHRLNLERCSAEPR
jgi:hypothetical protein